MGNKSLPGGQPQKNTWATKKQELVAQRANWQES